MSQLSRSYHDELLKDLTDPQEAAAYLNAALEEGSAELFLIALRNIAEARNLKKHDENILLSDLIRILDNAGLRFMPNHA
ncbi:MAG TPA: transcriptional regulator [Desulfobacteraceae bacterium]|nr:transcriptional regulator [Desulfobacteraceae bacterium]